MSLPLLFSLLALLVGPLVYRGARAQRSIAAVDAFALVAVAGLVFVHVLPESLAHAGWLVLPAALLGAFGPGFLCGTKLFHGRESRTITLPLALLAIALHAFLDGVAIASDEAGGHGGNELAFAVIIHRIPVGLGIWWLVRPVHGTRIAALLLASIGVFSAIGFHFGDAWIAHVPERGLALTQALLAGSLLHVILRHPPIMQSAGSDASPRSRNAASAVGGIAAVLMLFGMGFLHVHGDGHVHAEESVAEGFLALALESAPALLLAYVVVAGAHALVLNLSKLLRRGTPWTQALSGTVVGLPVPVCSCGVIPLYRSLVVSGVPATAAMAFLVSTPELELAAISLSFSLLGPEVTVARIAAAFVLALVVGRIVGARARPAEVSAGPEGQARPPLAKRLRDGLAYGFGDMVDSTAPWILVGIAIAAAAEPLLSPELFEQVPRLLEVPLFALIGMPLYVCASGSTPLVAVLLAKGVSPGAAIAFLMTGPATNLTTFGVLSRLHGRATAFAFAGTMAAFAVAIGYAVDGILPRASAISHEHHDHGATALQWGALIGLGGLNLVSLFRQGVRGFLEQVIAPHSHDHDHDHGGAHGHHHDHGHDHGHSHGS